MDATRRRGNNGDAVLQIALVLLCVVLSALAWLMLDLLAPYA